jgi:predicted aconitase
MTTMDATEYAKRMHNYVAMRMKVVREDLEKSRKLLREAEGAVEALQIVCPHLETRTINEGGPDRSNEECKLCGRVL